MPNGLSILGRGGPRMEWIGFWLFVLYHILNWKWHKNIVKGKYRSFRIFQLIINVALFLAMLGLMLSGIMLSNHVFSFLNIHLLYSMELG